MSAVAAMVSPVDPDLVQAIDDLTHVAIDLQMARRQRGSAARLHDRALYDSSDATVAEKLADIATRADRLRWDAEALRVVLETAAAIRREKKRKPALADIERALVRDAAACAERAQEAEDAALFARIEAKAARRLADATQAAAALFGRVT